MKKLVVGILGISLAFMAGLYGHVIYQNTEAKRRLEISCRSITGAFAPTSRNKLMASMKTLFGNDSEQFRTDVIGLLADNCDYVLERLEWSKWNLNVSVAIPIQPERAKRLKASMKKAGQSCPGIMKKGLSFLNLSPAELDKAVNEICTLLDKASKELDRKPVPVPIWEWPDRFEELSRQVDEYGA